MNIPAEAASWGRRRRSDWLRSQGVLEGSQEWNAAHSALAEVARLAAVEQARRQAERETARISPYLDKARWAVEGFGVVEEGLASPEEIEDLVIEEATRLADEADEAAAEAAAEAERQAREEADYIARQETLSRCVKAVAEAVDGTPWTLVERRCSHAESRYYWLLLGTPDDYEDRLSLRISDHHARGGSGWNEAAQTHYPEPDVNLVLRRGDDGWGFDLAPLAGRL